MAGRGGDVTQGSRRLRRCAPGVRALASERDDDRSRVTLTIVRHFGDLNAATQIAAILVGQIFNSINGSVGDGLCR